MPFAGSPLSVLRRAIKSGNLGSVDLALIDVPVVDLQDALDIVLLMAQAGDPRFDRWAERWVARAATEDARQLAALLERAPDEAAAAEALRERAARLRGEHASARIHTSQFAREQGIGH